MCSVDSDGTATNQSFTGHGNEPVLHGAGEQEVDQSLILGWLTRREKIDAGVMALDLELLARFDAIMVADLRRQHDLAL